MGSWEPVYSWRVLFELRRGMLWPRMVFMAWLQHLTLKEGEIMDPMKAASGGTVVGLVWS